MKTTSALVLLMSFVQVPMAVMGITQGSFSNAINTPPPTTGTMMIKKNLAPIDYTQTPWETLNEWLSKLNGNRHVTLEDGLRLHERGIHRHKVLEELERRFQNKAVDHDLIARTSADQYSVEELDALSKSDPGAFLKLKRREMKTFQQQQNNSTVAENKPETMTKTKHDKKTAPNAKPMTNRRSSPIQAKKNEASLDKEILINNSTNNITEIDDSVLGYGKDWKHYRNAQGYTHFEELLIYQPKGWRTYAREYMLRFGGDIDMRVDHSLVDFDKQTVAVEASRDDGFMDSTRKLRVARVSISRGNLDVEVSMKTPISVVLFHPEIPRCKRYDPLSFLLAYGAKNPLPDLLGELSSSAKFDDDDTIAARLLFELSPLDYFFDFQQCVKSYKLDQLRSIGAKTKFPRLCYIKELDFCHIIGQRMAKEMVRMEVVRFIWDRITETKGRATTSLSTHNKQPPLSLIFAGPSGVGKTELAVVLAKLMNKPDGSTGGPASDCFLKVDCGKLAQATEIFGLSGAYQGAEQGSALNNFILRHSRDPGSLGIVLLDEIEKSNQEVIHALYQVLDKGEWTNKRLQYGSAAQTEVVSCSNIIFILTTNAATDVIEDFARGAQVLYTAEDSHSVKDKQRELDLLLRHKLQSTHPFTDAFIARIDQIVPFLPMARGDPEEDHPLMGESMALAKKLIETEQEKLADDRKLNVVQSISSKNKHSMAKLVVMESVEEAGVRSLQKNIATRMGHQMKHALLLEDGGIESGSQVSYSASEEAMRVDWRPVASTRGQGALSTSSTTEKADTDDQP